MANISSRRIALGNCRQAYVNLDNYLRWGLISFSEYKVLRQLIRKVHVKF